MSDCACRYEKEYTPLRKGDIDDEPPPPLPPQDAYLQGRLQRFYAELAQYAPDVPRAAYEERLATLGDGLLPPAPDPYAPSFRRILRGAHMLYYVICCRRTANMHMSPCMHWVPLFTVAGQDHVCFQDLLRTVEH